MKEGLRPLTVRDLMNELVLLVEGEGKGDWGIRLRFVGTDNVIIGARLIQVKEDGFYQHINLIGPNEEVEAPTPKPAGNRCHKRQVITRMYGHAVQQCRKDFGHEGRHKFEQGDVTGTFSTVAQCEDWIRSNPL